MSKSATGKSVIENRWRRVRRWDRRAQEAVDWVCEQFPSDIQHRGIARGYYEYLWLLDELLSVLPSDLRALNVLDVGCGAGVLSLAMHHLGASVTALDRFDEYTDALDNQMGTTADILERFRRNGITVTRRDVVAEGLPQEPNEYDLVTIFAVIEHLPESPKAMLSQAFGLLKPGGRVVITTPNHAWIRTRLRLLFGRSAHHPLEDWWRPPFYGHVREYTMSEAQAMLQWSGFEIERSGFSSWQHVASRIKGTNGQADMWTTRLALHSVEQWTVAASLFLTALVPTLRYSLFLVGRKPTR